VPRQHEFRAALQRDEPVSIPHPFGVTLMRPLVAFLLLHERPNLIRLNLADRDLMDFVG
jgi:hypothetical protein